LPPLNMHGSIRDCGGRKMGAYSIDIVAVGFFILESTVYGVTPMPGARWGVRTIPRNPAG
jgi:hypothetical protein